MATKDSLTEEQPAAESLLAEHPPQDDALGALLHQPPARLHPDPLPQVVIGELVGIAEDRRAPLVQYPGQPSPSVMRARSILDLHGEHIGKAVVLSFENGDPSQPVVMGVLRSEHDRPLDASGHVQVEADGERMVISAKERLVLRCGEASITLTKAGKVIIEGSYVVSRAKGTNRVQGGSIQLN